MLSALIRKELFQCGGFCIVALIACAALPRGLMIPINPNSRHSLVGLVYLSLGFTRSIQMCWSLTSVWLVVFWRS